MAKPKMRSIKRGKRLYIAFNEREPERLDTVNVKDYKTLVSIGPCTHIAYIADDGKNYIHKFRPGSRPLLAVSDDGKQLVLLKGNYQFTDRGIVDK